LTPFARRAAALALVAAAWASAGAAPFAEALTEASEPIDFTRDYVAARARLDGVSVHDQDAGNAYAATIGAPRVVLLGAPYYVHPPTAAFVVTPLAPLGFAGAARAWLALSLAALAALAFVLASVITRSERPSPATLGLVFLLLALWPPVLHNLAKGQWSILLAALIALGWRALERGHARAAGALLGVAASLKATPVLLLGYLALRHRRAAGAMALTLAGVVLASAAAFGLEPWREWVANARPNALAWQTWTANTASLGGLFARLFTGSAFARPVAEVPVAAQALTLGTAALLVAGAVGASRRAQPSADHALFALWAAVAVVVNPLGWTHTTVMALLPLALVARDGASPALLVVLAALAVPRQTLAVLAGPLPVSPGRGLVLSLHAGALLLLIAAARSRTLAGAAMSPNSKSGAYTAPQ
jgi:hypothetical protein